MCRDMGANIFNATHFAYDVSQAILHRNASLKEILASTRMYENLDATMSALYERLPESFVPDGSRSSTAWK